MRYSSNSNRYLRNNLIYIAAKGSRITFEIRFIQILHITIDGRNWSLRAERWILNVPRESFAESIRNKSKTFIKKASDWIFELDNKILM